MAVDLLGLAVGVAGVVDEHGRPVAIDHLRSVPDAEQVRDGFIGVAKVGHILIDPRTRVFDDASAFGDGGSSVTTGGVDRGRADDKAHNSVAAE